MCEKTTTSTDAAAYLTAWVCGCKIVATHERMVTSTKYLISRVKSSWFAFLACVICFSVIVKFMILGDYKENMHRESTLKYVSIGPVGDFAPYIL